MSVHRRIAARAASKALSWQNVTFESSWFNWGSGYQTVQYRLEGDMVRVRGLARKNGAGTAGETIFALETGYRPPLRVPPIACMAQLTSSTIAAVRVDVETSGKVSMPANAATLVSGNWVSLDFSFSITA